MSESLRVGEMVANKRDAPEPRPPLGSFGQESLTRTQTANDELSTDRQVDLARDGVSMLHNQLKDPDSLKLFQVLVISSPHKYRGTWYTWYRGCIHYSATNSFGARIQGWDSFQINSFQSGAHHYVSSSNPHDDRACQLDKKKDNVLTVGDALGFLASGNILELTADTAAQTNTSLTTITGMTKTLPAMTIAKTWWFDCMIQFVIGTGGSTTAFGVQGATHAPTNMNASGLLQTNTTAFSAGVSGPITTTTVTRVVSAAVTPTTAISARITGTIEAATTGTVFNLSESTSAGTFIAKRGSACIFQ